MKKLLLLPILILFSSLAASAQWVNLPAYKMQKTADGYNYQFVYTNSGGGAVRIYQKAQIDSLNSVSNPGATVIRGSAQTTLVAGTKAVTIAGVTTSSQAQVTRVTATGTTLTVEYDAVCTAGIVTITATVAAGTINTADTSVINVVVYN